MIPSQFCPAWIFNTIDCDLFSIFSIIQYTDGASIAWPRTHTVMLPMFRARQMDVLQHNTKSPHHPWLHEIKGVLNVTQELYACMLVSLYVVPSKPVWHVVSATKTCLQSGASVRLAHTLAYAVNAASWFPAAAELRPLAKQLAVHILCINCSWASS